MVLNDKTIRASLLARLSASSTRPRAIVEELRVHNGNAIADVVAINKFAHCYEIKGETDSIYRLAHQGRYYDLAFPKTTLVTTSGQVTKALKLVPLHWGVMQASILGDRITLRYVRAAGESPDYDPKVALLTLWRSELIDMASALATKVEKLNRGQLVDLISPNLGKRQVTESISERLARRHGNPYVRDM